MSGVLALVFATMVTSGVYAQTPAENGANSSAQTAIAATAPTSPVTMALNANTNAGNIATNSAENQEVIASVDLTPVLNWLQMIHAQGQELRTAQDAANARVLEEVREFRAAVRSEYQGFVKGVVLRYVVPGIATLVAILK